MDDLAECLKIHIPSTWPPGLTARRKTLRELLSYGLIEIAAEKYRALLQQKIRNRNQRQDVYDLEILMREGLKDEVDPKEFLEAQKNSAEAIQAPKQPFDPFAPLAAVFRRVKNRVEHLRIRHADVAPLLGKQRRDAFVRVLREFHWFDSQAFSLTEPGPLSSRRARKRSPCGRFRRRGRQPLSRCRAKSRLRSRLA